VYREKTWDLIASPFPEKHSSKLKNVSEGGGQKGREKSGREETARLFYVILQRKSETKKRKKKFRSLSVQLRVDSVMGLLFVDPNHFFIPVRPPSYLSNTPGLRP